MLTRIYIDSRETYGLKDFASRVLHNHERTITQFIRDWKLITGNNIIRPEEVSEAIAASLTGRIPTTQEKDHQEVTKELKYLQNEASLVHDQLAGCDLELLDLVVRRRNLLYQHGACANSQSIIKTELRRLDREIKAGFQKYRIGQMEQEFGDLYQPPVNCSLRFGSGDYVFTDHMNHPRVYIETKNTLKAMFTPNFFGNVENMLSVARDNSAIAILAVIHPGDEEIFKSWFGNSCFTYHEYKRWVKKMSKHPDFRYKKIIVPEQVFSAPSLQDPQAVQNYLKKSKAIHEWVVEMFFYWQTHLVSEQTAAVRQVG